MILKTAKKPFLIGFITFKNNICYGLGSKVFEIFLDFGVCVCMHICILNEICQGLGPSLNMKAINVTYKPYTHSLKVILYNIPSALGF